MSDDDRIARLSREVKTMSPEELLKACAPLISRVTGHWRIPGLDYEDLRQEASIKLLWAQQAYREDGGRSFLGWALLALENRMVQLYQLHGPRGSHVMLECRACGAEKPPAGRFGGVCACGGRQWKTRIDDPIPYYSELAEDVEATADYDAVDTADLIQRLLDDDQTAPATRRIMYAAPHPGDVELVRRRVS